MRDGGVVEADPAVRARQQRAWNWYDWANSAFYTTVLSVLFAPYLITVAGDAAGGIDPRRAARHQLRPPRDVGVEREAVGTAVVDEMESGVGDDIAAEIDHVARVGARRRMRRGGREPEQGGSQ